jgi:hypothetical protein
VGGRLANRLHERAALAAIGLKKADTHETVRAHQLRDIERIARIVRALERILFEVRERETANRVGEGLLLFGEVELHLDTPDSNVASRRVACIALGHGFSRVRDGS